MAMSQFCVAAAILFSLSCANPARPPESAAELLRDFESTRVFWAQFEAAKKIAAAGDRSVLSKLEPWLARDDRHLRGNAAFVFAKLGDARGYATITGILNDRSSRGEGQAAALLAKDIWSVQKQIASDRYYAVHLLGELKDPAAVPALTALLEDPDVNYKVPWALGEIGGNAAVAGLIEALGNRSSDVRVIAIQALENLEGREALPHLRRLLGDNGRNHFGELTSVSEAARRAIAKLENR